MKILLVVPTHKYTQGYPAFLSVSDFPQGYAYISACLKEAGHDVYGLNLNNITGFRTAHELLTNKIHKAIEEYKPDLIGMGGICTDYTFLKDAMQVIRMFSKAPVVLGGGIVTHDAEFIYNHFKPDYAIKGEAELAMVALADGKIKEKGIIEAEVPDFDKLPFPDYDTFGIMEMLDKYSMATRLLYRYSRTNPRPMIISTARSCPFNCSFCVHNHGTKYRARSIDNIMAEIKEMYEKYHFNILITQDELFAVNKKRMVEFCQTLIDKKKEYGWDFDWMFQTHANARLDEETLKLAKESGCYFFSYGLESASPTVLKSMKKKTQIPEIVETIKMADKVGIGFGGNLIFGDIAETPETIGETMKFYYEYGSSEFIFLDIIMPYPGSKLFEFCQEKGLITDKVNYYENIERLRYNMTSMPNRLYEEYSHFFRITEVSWWQTKETWTSKIEVAEPDVIAKYMKLENYRLFATCPYCGEETEYVQTLPALKGFMGAGCVHCNKRIKINIRNGGS